MCVFECSGNLLMIKIQIALLPVPWVVANKAAGASPPRVFCQGILWRVGEILFKYTPHRAILGVKPRVEFIFCTFGTI